MPTDLFARRIRPPNRKEINDGVEEFLRNGGKIAKLYDSQTAEVILKKREKIQKKKVAKVRLGSVIGGSFLTSDEEAITKK